VALKVLSLIFSLLLSSVALASARVIDEDRDSDRESDLQAVDRVESLLLPTTIPGLLAERERLLARAKADLMDLRKLSSPREICEQKSFADLVIKRNGLIQTLHEHRIVLDLIEIDVRSLEISAKGGRDANKAKIHAGYYSASKARAGKLQEWYLVKKIGRQFARKLPSIASLSFALLRQNSWNALVEFSRNFGNDLFALDLHNLTRLSDSSIMIKGLPEHQNSEQNVSEPNSATPDPEPAPVSTQKTLDIQKLTQYLSLFPDNSAHLSELDMWIMEYLIRPQLQQSGSVEDLKALRDQHLSELEWVKISTDNWPQACRTYIPQMQLPTPEINDRAPRGRPLPPPLEALIGVLKISSMERPQRIQLTHLFYRPTQQFSSTSCVSSALGSELETFPNVGPFSRQMLHQKFQAASRTTQGLGALIEPSLISLSTDPTVDEARSRAWLVSDYEVYYSRVGQMQLEWLGPFILGGHVFSLSVDSDRVEKMGDWQRYMPTNSGISHIINVVGYDRGINPWTLELTDYFLVRDSLNRLPIYTRIDAEDLTYWAIAFSKINSVKPASP